MLSSLNKEEILRYLGYRQTGLTDRIEKLLERCMDEAVKVASPKYIYRRFQIQRGEEGIYIKETPICLKGASVREHLQGCREIYLLCATAGIGLDKRIRQWMVTEPDAGLVLDGCGIQAVEQVADMAEREIEETVAEEGLHLTWRFSPGYGDLPLDIQADILNVLDTHRKIGVSLNESCLMTPSKSVTAIAGICDMEKDRRENKCDYCNNRGTCSYRKRGVTC